MAEVMEKDRKRMTDTERGRRIDMSDENAMRINIRAAAPQTPDTPEHGPAAKVEGIAEAWGGLDPHGNREIEGEPHPDDCPGEYIGCHDAAHGPGPDYIEPLGEPWWANE